MKVGTKSILFGGHQFLIHPLAMAWAWWLYYREVPLNWRLWLAFIIHDWGYWGCPNMDGPEGENHPELGANLMAAILTRLGRPTEEVREWTLFLLDHSRSYAEKWGRHPSPLAPVDKLAFGVTPWWLWLPGAKLTGEFEEYRELHRSGKFAHQNFPGGNDITFTQFIQRQNRNWAWDQKFHTDGLKAVFGND